jgi:transketolase
MPGPRDTVIGLQRFGECGSGQEVAVHPRFSAAAVAAAARGALASQSNGGSPDGA